MEFIGKISDDYFLETKDHIVICGCGQTGKKVLNNLIERGLSDKVLGFCDRNIESQGTFVMEKLVYSYEEIIRIDPSAAYLIACADILQVLEILNKNNIKMVHITR